ncbi:MAG TPA: OsmC family protein [Allosphingosinicella sp.]|nr:OsmC family protein [Allosphingosinicella sp.]
MADHDAVIVWQSDGQFSTGRYSRAHQWRFDGGAIVPASSSPHVVPVPLSDPAGVDPEEALVASASSCHMLWFLDLARRAGFEVESYRDDAVGEVGKDERGRIALRTIRLRPAIVFTGKQPSADELERLHDGAHENCFIANSLRSEVVVDAAVEAED